MQSDFALVIEKRPVKNFWKGRGGFLPIAIVERMMQGSIEDAEQYFNGRSPEGVFAVSSHYGIARDGRVWQFVNDEDTAWSNGVLQNPDLSIGWLKEVYQEKVNCNLVTLSVDYEGYSGEALTPRQYEAALALHRQLTQRWEIEADNQHIIGHNWIDSLERSHNPGALFPFNQLLKDLHTAPSEMVQPPAPPNLLAYLESPMPEAEAEVIPPPVVETEQVAAYQPETVEEPAYAPQLEAFTFTPELNEEVDQVVAEPVEVEPATAEPESAPDEPEFSLADVPQDQPEEASAFEGVSPAAVDQPEEASAFEPEPALPAFLELPEEGLVEEPSQVEPAQAASPFEEAKSEEAAVSQETSAQPEEFSAEPAGEPAVAEEAPEAVSQEGAAEVVSQPEEALVEPPVEEAAEVASQPEETLVEFSPVGEAEVVSQEEPGDLLSQEAAAEVVSQEEPAETTSQEQATGAVSQPEEAPSEPAYQFEDFDLDDIEASLAYQPTPIRPAPARKEVQTAPPVVPQAVPVEEAAATEAPAEVLPEAQPEPVAPPQEVAPALSDEDEEAALEAEEPEAVAAEPASEPENQPEVFDAPGQPSYLADLETATFAAVEEAEPVATEPEVETAPESAEQAEPEIITEPAGQVEPISFEEAQPEEVLPSPEDSAALEAVPVETAEPALVSEETVVEETASPDHDDWAADLFAGDSVPGFFEEPVSTEPESPVRAATPTTDELEVPPAIGDDITPKYSRPAFFDTSYTYEPTPVELTNLDEVAAEPTPEAAIVSGPVEAEPANPVEEAVEAVPAELESAQEPAEAVAQATPAEAFAEPSGEEPAVEAAEVTGEAVPSTDEAAASEEAATPAVEEETVGEEVAAPAVEEASAGEEVAAPVVEEAPAPAAPEEASAVVAPVETAPEAQPETLSQSQEAAPAPVVQEVAPFPAPATPVETEKPEEKHHWYDRIFNLFGGHDNKPAQPVPVEPPAQSTAPVSFGQVEAPAPSLAPENAVETVPVETGPVPAFEAPQVYVTEPETYQPDYAAEQALFGSDDGPAPGTIEAATEPARFEAATIAQPEVLPVDFMPTPAEIGPEPVSPPAPEATTTVESSQETGTPVLQPETETTEPQPSPVYPPSEPAQEAESFYPFELETPKSTNYDAYYGSDSPDEQPGQSSSFNYDLTGFEKSSPASTYSQDYSSSGPSAYPFELPAEESSNNYFQSFAPSASPVEESQPEAVIPPFSLEPEKTGDQPSNLFDNAPSVAGHPQFTADDLELPSWLDEPATLQPEPEPAQAVPSATPPVEVAEPASEPEPEAVEEVSTPAGNDFTWAGNTTEEDELPGWLKAARDDSGLPDWLKASTEPPPTAPQPPVAAAPESAPASLTAPSPNLRDAPAVEIPNKDWLENENLFEDDDFFSLLNQSGLDLSLERGGTGTLNTPPASASTASSEAAPPATAGENTPVQPVQAAPAQPAPAAPAPSGPEPEFDTLFDEVEPNPAPAKVTVRQLIDRNDGYTAPLSYEDLDMSVPIGLDDDVTRPGTFQPVQPAPVAPPPPPVPTRAEPPGFHRVDLGRGRTSVELANVRTIPSYDKNTVVRVSEEGERFEFDGWIDGPELRGSTRWYRILTPSGDEWIHSTLVQLDRPFRG